MLCKFQRTGTDIAINTVNSGSIRWSLRLKGSGGWTKFHAGPHGGHHDCSVDRCGRRAAQPNPFYKHLYVQVLVAIAAGILLGHFIQN